MEESILKRMDKIKNENEKFFVKFPEANLFWEELKDIIKTYLGGQLALAAQRMYELCFSKIEKIATSFLDENEQLFRMRNSGDKFEEYSQDEMYHIPFEKNYLVSNERFSISGFPSLYLGASSYVCWEELGRPSMENVTLAIFRIKQYIKVIDLTYKKKQEIHNPLRHCLYLASTISVLHKDAPFKPEYIIPQLLLQGLVNYKKTEQTKPTDYAIKYTSTHYYDNNLWFGDADGLLNKFTNYVFAPIRFQEKGTSSYLKNLLECRACTNYNRFRLCEEYGVDKKSDKPRSRYGLSAFGRMEEYLKVQAHNMLTYNGLEKGMQTF